MDKNPAKNINEYIARFPEEIQLLLERFRATVQKAAPAAEEAIRYGMPTFRLHGNLLYFAAYKKHIGFYPGTSTIPAFKKELSPYRTSKNAVQFPLDRPLPLTLVAKMVRFRVKESLQKSIAKRSV